MTIQQNLAAIDDLRGELQGWFEMSPSRVSARSQHRSRVRFRERINRRRRLGSSGRSGVKRSAHIFG